MCRALGVYLRSDGGVNTNVATAKLQIDETQQLPANRIGGFRHNVTTVIVISESGLYKLIMRSDKAEAIAFQHWIASEVLPSIRKTGTYALADTGREAMPLPMDLAEALGLVSDNKSSPSGRRISRTLR